MELEQINLLKRIEAFQLDEPSATLTFTQRLARENGWSIAYAARVMVEYKRFVFLALASGHVACPSEDVDQAWHLHLTCTQSYWKKFCGEVLQTPLHHNPTKGGPQEDAKHRELYAQTLASYERCFGEPAPADIWPDVATRFGHATKFRRVDTSRHWVVPKPRWLPAAMVAVVALLAAGCSQALASWNVFDWRGPDFLTFFVIFSMSVFSAAFWWRSRLCLPDRSVRPDDLPSDPYIIACLTGGPKLAVNAAAAAIAGRKEVVVDQTDGANLRLQVAAPLAAEAHPFEQCLYEEIKSRPSAIFENLRAQMEKPVTMIQDQLRVRGLLVSEAGSVQAVWKPLLFASIVPAVGVVKILVGLSRNKPVALLAILTVFFLVAGLLIFSRRPRRSRLGNRVVTALRDKHAALNHRLNAASLASEALPMAVGLFGLGVLDGTALAAWKGRFGPAQVAASSGSGCGGAAGCGSGCGGGGGGGGCGGCGGGGS